VARELEISSASLRLWIKQDQLDAGERQDGLTTSEREELRGLRKQIRELEAEREILNAPWLSSYGRAIRGEHGVPPDRGGEQAPTGLPPVPGARRYALGVLCVAALARLRPADRRLAAYQQIRAIFEASEET
jgi:Transposase